MLINLNDDARRQYIDACSTFTALEAAKQSAAQVRGGMYWKKNANGSEYLIRTGADNTQKSLGPRSSETEEMYANFHNRKKEADLRLAALDQQMTRHVRMCRALHVGRVPQMVVSILEALEKAKISEHFSVIGTHALYAYESQVGVRFEDPGLLATKDVDLLWDTRKRISFMAQMKLQASSLLGLLQKVDSSFQLRPDQPCTAVNSQGFEVDVIRREAREGDPHPLKVTDNDEEFWAVQAIRAGVLLSSPGFSSVVVSSNGQMARMRTISPVAFVKFKEWMSAQPNRDPIKRSRDIKQAEAVARLVEEYYPTLDLKSAPAVPRPGP